MNLNFDNTSWEILCFEDGNGLPFSPTSTYGAIEDGNVNSSHETEFQGEAEDCRITSSDITRSVLTRLQNVLMMCSNDDLMNEDAGGIEVLDFEDDELSPNFNGSGEG